MRFGAAFKPAHAHPSLFCAGAQTLSAVCAFLTHRFVKYNLQAAEKAGLTETAFRKQSSDWTKVRAETMCLHRRASHTATHLAFALHHIHMSAHERLSAGCHGGARIESEPAEGAIAVCKGGAGTDHAGYLG